MTIEELNAIYEAADFGNQGNYKAPTTSNIDLTAPVVESIPAIQPYIPPFIQNQGDGGDNFPDPPTDPMSFGQNDIPGYNQLNIAGPVKGLGIQSLIDAYKKFSPLGMVYRAGNNIVTNTQKYFADKKKQKEIELQEEITRENEAAANRARVEAYTGQPMSDYRQSRPRSEQNYTGGGPQANDPIGGFENKSGMGRTGYGKGGIVTL